MFRRISFFFCCVTAFLSALVAGQEPRYVFTHFMVGNTYPYTIDDWTADIVAARALGIDGFALNIGDDPWQPTQVAYAYGAAANLFNAGNGTTPFYLFISFDMTIISDPTTIVGYIQEYHGHSNQLVYQGKDFVSTFSGEYVYFGQDNLNDAWQIDVKDVLAGSGIEIYFVPSWSALAPQGVFDAYPVLDGIFCWTAWPNGDTTMTDSVDQIYMSGAAAAGKTYMAPWSAWFHTHFSYKNWIYNSETLFIDRWNELISLAPPLVELISFNDYGESHYLNNGQEGALPAGSAQWVDGFDHSGWQAILQFFIYAYKNSLSLTSVPVSAITTEQVVFWYRTHSINAAASADPIGPPTGYTWPEDNVQVVALLQSDATIVVNSGSYSQSFAATAGFNFFVLDGFQEGTQVVEVVRNGAVTSCGVGEQPINNAIEFYNYNAALGVVAPGTCSGS